MIGRCIGRMSKWVRGNVYVIGLHIAVVQGRDLWLYDVQTGSWLSGHSAPYRYSFCRLRRQVVI